MPYTHADWEVAKATIANIEEERKALLAPTQARYEAALDKLSDIEDDLSGLDGVCEGCDTPIFEGDPHYISADSVMTCRACAPMLSDIVEEYRTYQKDPESHFEDLGFNGPEELIEEAEKLELDLSRNGDRKVLNVSCEDHHERH
ncbi:hypothetical protein GCM10007094_23190 [Pseudovibrio japonicus]|uniref:DksA C4-type domain-containing protein n=1 Tax=Pseudovibrio japonicus TaxID=366534 RepID=A0ABQ3EGA1_9HYPH|nr:hypothetical protein [Pseudovibrio japonicus]GHB33723.1 hypothetical protein GCM10007094_23190 [Pseudovibrio japonicus]